MTPKTNLFRGCIIPILSAYDFLLIENTTRLIRVNEMEGTMNLSAPTMPIFLISLILAILAVLGVYIDLPVISGNAFWVAVIAYIVLLVGNVAKGL
jgi:hypothetical protein